MSGAGISLRSQELYFCVFLTRYVDSFVNYENVLSYTFATRVYLMTATSVVLVLFYVNTDTVRTTYDSSHDTTRHWATIAAPCALLSVATVLFESRPFAPSVVETLFTFSVVLEGVALIPQIRLLHRQNTHVYFDLADAEEVRCSHLYLLFVLAFRALHILHWTLGLVRPCGDVEERASHSVSVSFRHSDAGVGPLGTDVVFCSDEEPWNTHHFVVYAAGVVQAASVSWFFRDLRRRGMAIVPRSDYRSSRDIALTRWDAKSNQNGETTSTPNLYLGSTALL